RKLHKSCKASHDPHGFGSWCWAARAAARSRPTRSIILEDGWPSIGSHQWRTDTLIGSPYLMPSQGRSSRISVLPAPQKGHGSISRSVIASLLFGVADDALYRLVNFLFPVLPALRQKLLDLPALLLRNREVRLADPEHWPAAGRAKSALLEIRARVRYLAVRNEIRNEQQHIEKRRIVLPVL